MILEMFNNNEVKKEKQATVNQYKTYVKLCKSKRIEPENFESFNFDNLSREIDRLINLKVLSESQIELINTKLNILFDLKDKLSFNDEQVEAMKEKASIDPRANIAYKIVSSDKEFFQEYLNKLTPGKDGTGSKFIAFLIELENQFNSIKPISKEQLQTITGYFYCPDVPFEDVGIERTVPLEDGYWRKKSLEEFERDIENSFSYEEAKDFIWRNRGVFYSWKKSRITLSQLKTIKSLQESLANDYSGSVETETAELDGSRGNNVVTMKSNYVVGDTYSPMTEETLIQLSKEQADILIDQLKSEIGRVSISQFTSDEYDKRSILSKEDLIKDDFEITESIMYGLFSLTGVGIQEELIYKINISLVTRVLIDGNTEEVEDIKDFFRSIVKESCLTLSELAGFISDSKTLSEILLS